MNINTDHRKIMDDLQEYKNFDGIWISKEIWFNTAFSLEEKCFLAVINFLEDKKTGCTLSNSYLCKILNYKERSFQRILSKLKSVGAVISFDFNGRSRSLKTFIKNEEDTSKS